MRAHAFGHGPPLPTVCVNLSLTFLELNKLVNDRFL